MSRITVVREDIEAAIKTYVRDKYPNYDFNGVIFNYDSLNNVNGAFIFADEKLLNEEPTAEITAKDCNGSSLAQQVASLNRQVESLNDQLDSLAKNQIKQAEEITLLDKRSEILETPDEYDGETITIPRWLFELMSKDVRR
jgi:hypothetical protein